MVTVVASGMTIYWCPPGGGDTSRTVDHSDGSDEAGEPKDKLVTRGGRGGHVILSFFSRLDFRPGLPYNSSLRSSSFGGPGDWTRFGEPVLPDDFTAQQGGGAPNERCGTIQGMVEDSFRSWGPRRPPIGRVRAGLAAG